jgi:hypothetical protein
VNGRNYSYIRFSYFTPPAETPFKAITGILRLSHKYDVPYLRRRALEHFGALYPTSLSVYDAKTTGVRISGINDHTQMIIPLQVASEIGALWLLPVAYFELCTQDISWILSDPYWKQLGEKERTACLVGHQAQTEYFHKTIAFLSVSKDDEADCDDWTECNQRRLEVDTDHIWENMRWTLDAWSEGDWTEMAELGICDGCIEEAKALYAAARQVFWDQLPQMFGLPGWEELEEMRRVALAQ